MIKEQPMGVESENSSALGATWDGKGVNFSVFSQHAEKVQLCLFDSADSIRASRIVDLDPKDENVWRIYVPDLKPGQLYGFRVFGPYEPKEGHRFNGHKILLDPYAKAIGRLTRWDASIFGYKIDSPRRDLIKSKLDNAAHAPLGVVIDSAFDWENVTSPKTPLKDSVIYEVHVKGMTMLHPEVPEHLRGTYLGLASAPVIRHLKELGVTAVELMPVHHHIEEKHLTDKKLNNYWGYSTLSFFAPDSRYATAGQDPLRAVTEFKEMVKKFHQEGIEVILDVVYNHTAEGNQLGPTLSLRGFDNAVYYCLEPKKKRYYRNYTGCGNTVNLSHPDVQQLVLDSLRYWASEMHVDGFRFDLAVTLGRDHDKFHPWSPFFQAVHNDPVLSQLKLIAEPWDIGPHGYQLGSFPPGWSEWNGRYRDTIRGFWKGDEGTASELVTRLCGSSDLFEKAGRLASNSINFITSHDGFTLQDLVSYNDKHNHANGEGNRDGDSHNISWNCGVEGPTDDAEIIKLRERQKRNMMATLIFSHGVPMISGGDELSRSQRGNNNGYCQDNDLSWNHWHFWSENQHKFLAYMKQLIGLRKQYQALRRQKFFHGRDFTDLGVKDITCYEPNGKEMSDKEWAHYVRCLGVLFSGDHMRLELKTQGVTIETLLLLMNAHHEKIDFTLPKVKGFKAWKVVLDTAEIELPGWSHEPGAIYELEHRSLTVFSAVKKDAQK